MVTTSPASAAQAIRSLQRSALPAATTWDAESRSATVILSTERDVGDGFLLLHNADAFEWPLRPIQCVLDHIKTAESVWGVLTDLRFEVIDRINSLVGTVVLDGAPEAMALAEPRLRNGSARYSVGARAREYTLPTAMSDPITVTRWFIAELSMVVEGQDDMAIQRSNDLSSSESLPMTVENTAGSDPATATTTPEPVERAAAPVAPAPLAPTPPAPAIAETEVLDRAALKRERDILRSCSAAGLDHATAQAFIDSGRPWSDVVHQIITDRANRQAQGVTATPVSPIVTQDAAVKLDRGLEAYMAHRSGLDRTLDDSAREFRGMRMLDVARHFLEARGINTRGESINAICDRAFHSTSDFPLLLANVARKSLSAGYAEEEQTWKPLARQKNLPDFKPMSEVQVQGAITLNPLLENGEYEGATLVEAAGSWQILTYARRLPIGRNLIINDDLGGLNDVPAKMGRGARLTENNLVWSLFTTGANGTNSAIDNTAVFAAGHNNTGAGAIGITGIDTGITAMRKQTDIAGNNLSIPAKYLIVPPELRTVALQFLYPTGYAPAAATGAAGPNPFAGGMELIIEPRLSANSLTRWYLGADPGRIDMIRFGYLDGQEGPEITSIEKRNPDGVELLVREDFGCTLLDFRGFYRSTGV